MQTSDALGALSLRPPPSQMGLTGVGGRGGRGEGEGRALPGEIYMQADGKGQLRANPGPGFGGWGDGRWEELQASYLPSLAPCPHL